MTKRKDKPPLTQARLMELLIYEYWTGWWLWLVPRGNGIKPGDRAGTINKGGYRCIMIDGILYRSARLAWLYVTGSFPPPDREIDHRNGRRHSDKWLNLRLATKSQNQANRKAQNGTALGKKGMYISRKTGKYGAHIRVQGVRRFLGYHDTEEAAAAAYWEAAQAAFGRFARRG